MPTLEPTITPTLQPTYFPTNTPSLFPSNFPTISPTDSPSLPPSQSPSFTPSFSPSVAPTFSPTKAPSNIPTAPPSNAPSMSPTLSPSLSPVQPPTNAPTFSPTISPTHSPTRHPTQWIYDGTIWIDYNITNITANIANTIYSEEKVKEDIENLIEFAYLKISHDLNPNDTSQHLHYRQFNVQIEEVIQMSDHHASSLQSKIYYANETGVELRYFSQLAIFKSECERLLRKYFHYNGLNVIVGRTWEESDDRGDGNDEIDHFPIVITCIGIICVIIGCASFMYNNWYCDECAWTDNGNSMALPLYGLQVVDLLSDVNLTIEIFFEFDNQMWTRDHLLLHISGWGCMIFTFLPYVCNVVFAANIRNFKEVRENTFARSYFQKTSWFFIVLVVFCGGVYPALSMVSSRLFAFEFLNSGLSGMELTRLTKLRLFGTVCLENIPQLIFAITYIMYMGTPSKNTILSMVLSVLQITATIVNWIVNCRSKDCKIIQYDLEMLVGDKHKKQIYSKSDDMVEDGEDSEDSELDLESDPTTRDKNDYLSIFDLPRCHLSKPQKRQIRQRKERKASLRRWLCTELGLRLNCIEIGYITLTPTGCIVRVLHSTFESELNRFGKSNVRKPEELSFRHKSKSTDSVDLQALSPTWNRNQSKLKKTARTFFKHLYKSHRQEVNVAFASHFGFGADIVTVLYHKKYPYSKWDLANKTNFSYRQITPYFSDTDHDHLPDCNWDEDDDATSVPLPPKPSCAGYETIETVQSVDIELGKNVFQSTPSRSLESNLDEIKQIGTLLKDKLVNKDVQQAKEELVKDGYDEKLLDVFIDIGRQLSTQNENEEEDKMIPAPVVNLQISVDIGDLYDNETEGDDGDDEFKPPLDTCKSDGDENLIENAEMIAAAKSF